MIQTVLGPIEASKLGVTMAHEHLSVDLGSVRGDEDSIFTDSPLVRSEMGRLHAAGVDSVVEVSCIDMGRNASALVEISRASGLNIICSTGFYLEKYHPAWLKEAPVSKIEDTFRREFAEGIDGTDVNPGVIGEVAGEKTEITESETKVMVAAAHVASEVGCAVTTHCQLGCMAPEQADLLLGAGMKPEKVILGHLDLADDLDYYRRVLARGVNIGFDTCGKVAYLADERRAQNLAVLAAEGFAGQIVLSTDISRQSYMHGKGGFGYTAVIDRVLPMAREAGLPEDDIDTMMVSNPARIFDIEGGLR
ncbi:phosphotriesterase [Olsenella sp. Marseille-P4559]|uniref:phosphotriesterase family protein n=1 Tax=Olsenella sp. Marseille-P4559 TaxID=2364795 RepID=UPI00102F78D8|nr:phosphotriesterase-related protein [Olsenella sp. Marseille-P4559]